MKKRLRIILIVLIIVIFIGCAIYLKQLPSTRGATDEEIAQFSVYVVDWKAAVEAQEDTTAKEIILSMCTPDHTENDGAYQVYTSDGLQQYLYQYGENLEIGMEEDVLYVGYVDVNGYYVLLMYNDDGLYEFGVHNPETESMYYEKGGTGYIVSNVERNVSE